MATLLLFAVVGFAACKSCNGNGGNSGSNSPVIEECSHTYSDWTIKTAATCTGKGEEVRACTKCGDEQTQEIAALGHEYSEWTVKTAATCTEKGEEVRACTKCGDEKTQEIAALGHEYSEWTVKTAATCTEKGKEVRACTKCGDEQSQEITALGHNASEKWTSDKNSHWHACQNTGCTAKLDEAEHGEIDHYCSVCDYKTSNHDYGEVTYTWSDDYSVCTATRNCSRCSVGADGHTQTANAKVTSSVKQSATCLLPELTTYTATFTDTWAITQTAENVKTKDALNHDYGEVTYTWSDDYSVCTATRNCSKCSAGADGHTQTANAKVTSSVKQSATCLLPELTTYTATFTDTWATTQTKENVKTATALGHEYSDWTVKTAATCTEKGKKVRSCTKCGYEQSQEITALGHNPSETWTSDKNSHWHTCQNTGCTAKLDEAEHSEIDHYCSVCDYKTSDHDYGEVTYTWSDDYSVCTATRNCLRCSVGADGHTQTSNAVISTSVQNATCESPELTTYTATFTDTWAITQTVENVKTKDALNHDYGEVTYTWSDDYSVCTAIRNCSKCSAGADGHTQTSNAVISTSVQNATCESPELTTYTATFTDTWAITQTAENVKTKDALNHDYGEVTYTWSDEDKKVTATRVCKNDDSHVETETVALGDANCEKNITQEKTCLLDEISTLVVTFNNKAFASQTKENVVTDKAAGSHDWDLGYSDTWCNRCGYCTFTKQLSFTYDEENDCYTVKKLNSSDVTDVIVPAHYCEKPVVGIDSQAFMYKYNIKSVTLPDSIATIGSAAFYQCKQLESIAIPANVTKIGGSTFQECEKLSAVYISDLSAWCKIQFSSDSYTNPLYCAKKLYLKDDSGDYRLVEDLVIPSDVDTVQGRTFYGAECLKSVTISAGVTSIGAYAFGLCSNLKSVTIPASITAFGEYAFYCCNGLTGVYIDDVSAWCKIDFADGSDKSYHANPLYYAKNLYLKGASNDYELVTSLVIPNDIETIKKYAFYNATCLSSVTIPESVTSIETQAFYECRGLVEVINNSALDIKKGDYSHGYVATYAQIVITDGSGSKLKTENDFIYSEEENGVYLVAYKGTETELVLPDTLGGQSYSIGDSAFQNNTSITSIKIPGSVTSIGKYAFAGCSGLTSIIIPEGVTSIGQYAFSGCSGLTSVTISKGVTSIGQYAFYGCNKLTGVYISDLAAWCSISFGGTSDVTTNPLYYAKNLYLNDTLIETLIIPDEVTTIKAFAFYNAKCLRSVILHENVTSIGKEAFNYCNNLVEVVNNSKLSSITAGSTSNGYVAYYAVSITTGESKLKAKGDFVYVEGETENTLISYTGTATELVLPDELGEKNYSIHDKVFINNTALTSVTISKGVTAIGDFAFYGCSSLTTVIASENDSALKTIGFRTFYNCAALTSVTIPSSVTSIGDEAFNFCSGLTSLNIKDDSSLKTIGKTAFNACKNLTSVTIPAGVTSIGENAFNGCSALTGVYISDLEAWCNIAFDYGANPLYYAHYLYLNNKLLTELVIPDSITKIGQYAFYNATCLTSVTIPANVKSIGQYAFFGCSGITSVIIPEGVTSIGDDAFYSCHGLTSITIPASVTSIGSWAFHGCKGLTGVYISDSDAWCKIAFGNGANPLYYAHNLYLDGTLLTDLVIPDSVTEIGQYALYGAACLTSVTIHANVTSIGQYAFYGCSGLKSIAIPGSVTSIGQHAFFGCRGLTSIVIPEGVTSIDQHTFNGCSGLTSVTIPASVTSIGSYAFKGCSSLKNVYYTGTADKWEGISISFENTPLTSATMYYYSEAQPTEEGNYWYYDKNGTVAIW